MMKLLRAFIKHDEGATAIEYAMIVALFSIAVIFGSTILGSGINNTFNAVRTTLSNVH